MNLKVGIIGLPNVGPGTLLSIPVVYVHASWWRKYGAALSSVMLIVWRCD